MGRVKEDTTKFIIYSLPMVSLITNVIVAAKVISASKDSIHYIVNILNNTCSIVPMYKSIYFSFSRSLQSCSFSVFGEARISPIVLDRLLWTRFGL